MRIAVLAAAISMLLGLLWHHYQLVVFPTLLDYNEGAMPMITQTIMSGDSPYSLASQPARISVYPPLYNLVVAPVAVVLGNSLTVHRLVAGGFILASVMLCCWATQRSSRSVSASLAAAVIMYAGLLYYSTPIASPNSVGLFFFLLSITIAWFGRFTRTSLGLALVAGLLAFFGKQYFVASLGYIALYLFLFVSKKKAVLFGLSSGLAFIASILLVQHSSPYFVDNTIFSVSKATSLIGSTETLLKQLLTFSKTYLALFVLLAIACVRAVYFILKQRPASLSAPVAAGKRSIFNVRELDEPLIDHQPDYFWFCFACSLGIIVFVIGRNPGNHMTYLFQLMAPFFLISVFTVVARADFLKWLAPPLILYSLYISYSMLPGDFSHDTQGWDRLKSALAGKTRVYASPVALPLLVENGSQIYNNGHTGYAYYGRFKPMLFRKAQPEETNAALWEAHVKRIHNGIAQKEFEMIVLDEWSRLPEMSPGDILVNNDAKILKGYYELTGTIQISLANRPGGGRYTMKIWEPRE